MYKVNDEIFLESSKDGLEGYITIVDKDEFSIEDKMEKIRSHFKFGLNEPIVRQLLELRAKVDKSLVAEGKDSIDGKNGSIKYEFETNKPLIPKMNVDGTVDYRELDSINKVTSGEVLATIIPPIDGIAGKKVTGESIPFKKGKMPKFRMGKNTVISEDGIVLKSSVDGLIENIGI